MHTAVCWEATFLSVEVTAIIFSRRQEIGVTEMTQGRPASPIENSKQLPEVPDRPWATPLLVFPLKTIVGFPSFMFLEVSHVLCN